ncbi:hypothetical protein MHC_04265 [Mycoplasma haemocanis str. Illinois]|uniref:Uncharacterized protein n=1 Tax=Mycoplasma haemocanis (strain Illinois) TaxID=1111676 RepID=H6N7T7_MYCHN|nr:hypothetical protein [Mycoplasma haemocanis]AEW45709.1 hypothetical protein MHC_04265 [Mycoplasma haemocanis str. Illinois]
MSYKLSKLITLAGGGISVSSSMLFGPKEESTLYKTTSSNIDDKELKSEPTSTEREQSRATTVVTKKCFIFVTDAAVGQREDTKITKILKKYEDFEKFLAEITGNESFKKDVKTSNQTTPKTTCTIYEEDDPGTGSNRVFKKLLKKFNSKEEFYAEFKTRAPINESDTRKEIDTACSKGIVYVWYGNLRDKKTWIYSSYMQQDWINKEVDKSAILK